MATNIVPDTAARPPIHLLDSESDLLGELALRTEQRAPVVAAMLLAEIDRAQIHSLETLPSDVVTLGSHVDFIDDGSQSLRSVQIVLPAEADIEAGRISIMTPVGAGLIGLSAGQAIEWPDLEGRARSIKILAVRQPPRGE